MRIDQHDTVGGAVSGRTIVKARAYRTVTEAATAAVIGVPRDDVKVDVAEHREGFAIRIATPLPIPSLEDSAEIAAGAPVLERARQLQEALQHRLAHLLGREITRINLTITGATTPRRRRVQ